MKKQAFVVLMKAIQDQMAKDNETGKLINRLGDSEFKPGIVFTTPMLEQVTTALKIEFADEFDWISYFIYELDFGKKADFMEVTIHNKSYKIFSAGHLYDLLVNEIKEDD